MDQVLGQADLWIEDLLTIDADQMRMRLWVVAVVAIVAVAESQFQHLIHILQDIQGFVHSGQTRRGELVPDLTVQVGCTGMPVAGGQQPKQGDALRRKPVFALSELVDQFLKPGV